MKIQKELIEDLRTVKRTCFILDENVFGSFVKETSIRGIGTGFDERRGEYEKRITPAITRVGSFI